MPLDFVEQDKAQGPVILFNADSKARPQHLETEVLPNLISKVRQGGNSCMQHRPPTASNKGMRDLVLSNNVHALRSYAHTGRRREVAACGTLDG